MRRHNDEKIALESAAIEIFIKIYNSKHPNHYELFERRECPDFVLRNVTGELLGLEVAHLYYDSEEAKMLLGRSKNMFHGIETINELVETLNKLLDQKESKLSKYEVEYPVSLLIRNASPIFGMSDLLRVKDLIFRSNNYKNVWLLSRDGSNNNWLEKDILTY